MRDKPNIIIGNKAERFVAEELAKKGAIVHDLRSPNGSQPYDQIAITKDFVFCYDVKHCSNDRFDFYRVENNQQSALTYVHSLNNDSVVAGFVLVYNDGEGYDLYFLSMYQYEMFLAEERKSIKVSILPKLLEVVKWKINLKNYTK